jgi:two-component system catabolic regulation response regulator CreB/two-component system response regulator ChvI
VCFITAYEIYYETLKKEFPSLDVGCFIKKPIGIEELVNRGTTISVNFLAT